MRVFGNEPVGRVMVSLPWGVAAWRELKDEYVLEA